MRSRSPLFLATITATVATLLLAAAALAAPTTLTADLAGSAETDEDGSGTATVTLDPEAGTACWEMMVENVEPITVSHIHDGAEGEDGPVVVDLDLEGFETSSEGCTEGVAADTLQAIIDNPSEYYVNVHNEPFPGGAIRGQLMAGTDSPDTAVPASTNSPILLGLLLVGVAAVIGLRHLPARPHSR